MNRLIILYNKLFVVWVILGGILAYLRPEFFINMKGCMELFFAITMFGIGMVLNSSDFIHIFRNYKVIIVGVIAQFSIMPISAYLISKLFAFSNDFSLGFILTGSAPGAMASNVLSYLAGADVAYSISLTTVSTLLSPILTPMLTLALAHTYLDIPFWGLVKSVSFMVLLPLFLGIFVKKLAHDRVHQLSKIFPAISTTFIAFICALVIALNRAFIQEIDAWIFIAAIILNCTGLILGYNIGRLFNFDLLKKRALSIEIGMQNAGLGSVLALKHFNEKTALPAVIFVFICIFSASMLVPRWSADRKKRDELAHSIN